MQTKFANGLSKEDNSTLPPEQYDTTLISKSQDLTTHRCNVTTEERNLSIHRYENQKFNGRSFDAGKAALTENPIVKDVRMITNISGEITVSRYVEYNA
jgi:hypothetical protein